MFRRQVWRRKADHIEIRGCHWGGACDPHSQHSSFAIYVLHLSSQDFSEAFVNPTNSDIDPRILYLIVVPDWQPEEATPLEGFALSLCENSWLIRAICWLPSTIADISNRGRRQITQRRMTGGRPLLWHGQSPRAILSSAYPPNVPFVVVLLGDDLDPKPYMAWSKSLEASPTIVSKEGGHLTYNELTIRGLAKRFQTVCDALPSSIDRESVGAAKSLIGEWKSLEKKKLAYTVGGHNSVTPNVLALESAGYRSIVRGRMEAIGSGDGPYVQQIVQTSQSVFDERERNGIKKLSRFFKPTFDLNLFAPAVYPSAWTMKPPATMDDREQRRFGLALRIMQEQRGYGFTSRTEAQHNAFLGLKEGESEAEWRGPHPLMQLRQKELFLATDCIATLAVSEFSAVVRLPNAVNRASGIVRNFAQQYRSDETDPVRRLRGFRRVQQALSKAVPQEFLQLVRNSRTGVRVVADAHLEWLDIDGLPLCIRKETARIPVTPGNSFIGNLTVRHDVLLVPDDFNRVLVLSALKKDDPLRGLMEMSIKEFGKEWGDRLRVEFAEVASEADFVDALNRYEGSIVIFDGHGGHAKDGAGMLSLQGFDLDVWTLKDRINRVPPIVLLSACDTHAADRNHGTVANAFIALGATTVLASVFPLDGSLAAIFIGRLLLRIAMFVPVALNIRRRPLTWAEVVSGMLRMQLVTDYLRRLLNNKAISEEQYREVHEAANLWVNLPTSDPFERLHDRLLSLGLKGEDLREERDIAVANSSTIAYLQVGRPELLHIVPGGTSS